jgi:hypothetical protein
MIRSTRRDFGRSLACDSDSIWSMTSVGTDTPKDLYFLNDFNNYNIVRFDLRELIVP